MSSPLVSVVIDNFNYERFLSDAIDSALAQNHAPVEVVCVDDGSTDASRAIIERYGSSVVPVLKANGGQASAFNAGLAASQGEIVIFLDADDVLLPAAAKRAADVLSGSSAVKAHWPLRTIGVDGAPLGGTTPNGSLSDGDLRDSVIRKGPMAQTFPPTSGNAWRRNFLDRVGPIPEDEFEDIADSYLAALAPLAGSIARIDEPLTCYRIHGENREGGRSAYERTVIWRRAYERQCDAIARYLAAEGIQVKRDAWTCGDERYRAMQWLEQGTAAICRLVQPGERFILLDDDQWDHHSGSSEVASERYAVPFPEYEGGHGGHPADSQVAIAELERLRADGVRLLFVAWSAYWWLDHYSDFARHIRERYVRILDAEYMQVFDLAATA